GFIDIETPILAQSSPEGANCFVVPSNLTNRHYTLPQSAQIFKQLLMVSGFDKYYQIAKSFRNEDARSNRQIEFSQLELEMSFITSQQIKLFIEKFLKSVLKKVFGYQIKTRFPTLTYQQYNQETKKYEPFRHPFTTPQKKYIEPLLSNKIKPEKIIYEAFDLVCNGEELLSGTQAILQKSRKNITERVKKDIKIIQEQIKSFKSGANSYLTSFYQNDKSKIEKLEKDLENISTSNTTQSPKSGFFRPRVMVPLALALVLVTTLAIVNAFVVELLEKKKKILLGKTVLDEFACGGTGLYAATGPLFNPYNSSGIVGGSSSVPFALGHDTGDSIRRPASYCGIVGFKPSYGLLSRAGVIPMASSLDTVGILARKTQIIKSVLAIISQKDPHDLLTEARRNNTLSSKNKKVAVVSGIEKYLPTEL
ncbi:7776_t:CDS:2, partial [Scutellospora calospora]